MLNIQIVFNSSVDGMASFYVANIEQVEYA